VDCLAVFLLAWTSLALPHRTFSSTIDLTGFQPREGHSVLGENNFFLLSSVMEVISVSTSLEEAHTTLQEDAFPLPLDLLVTVVHYWLRFGRRLNLCC